VTFEAGLHLGVSSLLPTTAGPVRHRAAPLQCSHQHQLGGSCTHRTHATPQRGLEPHDAGRPLRNSTAWAQLRWVRTYRALASISASNQPLLDGVYAAGRLRLGLLGWG